MTIVDAVRRNGVPFEQAVITHAELLGSTLDFSMR